MKQMKRITALICAIVILFSAVTVSSAAGMHINAESKTIAQGNGTELVEIPLTLSGNPGILSASFKVTYDEGLVLTAIERGDALSSLTFTKPKKLTTNPFRLLWDNFDEVDTSNGLLATLTFEVPKGVSKTYSITIKPDPAYDFNVDPVTVTATNATITVSSNVSSVTLSTINGAQIRTTGMQGLRFISSIEKNEGFDRVVEYGTVLIPSADITDISQLTIGATLNGHKVAKVPAIYLYDETNDAVTYTTVIINIKEANYAREYTARAYAILDDGTVVYANSVSSRSIYSVAKRGLENPNESAANKAIFQSIVDTVEGAV